MDGADPMILEAAADRLPVEAAVTTSEALAGRASWPATISADLLLFHGFQTMHRGTSATHHKRWLSENSDSPRSAGGHLA